MTWTDEGWVGEHWGSAGSGLLLTTGTRILLLLRSWAVADPGVWGIPGGAIPRDEDGERMDALVSAHKETEEELGTDVPRYEVVGQLVYEAPDGFTYVTVVGRVSEEAVVLLDNPPLNWESDESMWATEADLEDLSLHPGVAWAVEQIRGRIFDRAGSAAIDLGQIERQVVNPGDWVADLDPRQLQAAAEHLKVRVVADPALGWRLLRMDPSPLLPIRVLALSRSKEGAVVAVVAVYPPQRGESDAALRAYRRVLGRLRPRVAERRMIRPAVPGGMWHGWHVWRAPIRLSDAKEAGLGG